MADFTHIKSLKHCPNTGKKLTEDQIKWNEALEQLKKEE